jgi:hypothetical protein
MTNPSTEPVAAIVEDAHGTKFVCLIRALDGMTLNDSQTVTLLVPQPVAMHYKALAVEAINKLKNLEYWMGGAVGGCGSCCGNAIEVREFLARPEIAALLNETTETCKHRTNLLK